MSPEGDEAGSRLKSWERVKGALGMDPPRGQSLGHIEAASDATLVEMCRRHEEAAWRVLVERHAGSLYGIARRSGLDGDAAADVVQTVFLTLLQNLERLRQPEQLGAWLTTTAKRASWRLASRDAIGAQAEAVLAEPCDLAGPDDEALESEERRQLASAFRALDERSRKLLWLLFYDQRCLSYDQIARELHIPRGSVGPLRARALAKLKGAYEGLGQATPTRP